MKTNNKPNVRRALEEDAEQIAHLAAQLGYSASPKEIASRLRRVSRSDCHAILVAESHGNVLGWIHVIVEDSLLTDIRAEIAGLVVDELCRRSGVGQLLMEHAEQWALGKGCRSVRLRSNVKREAAHAFYDKLGYTRVKTQIAFAKELEYRATPRLAALCSANLGHPGHPAFEVSS